MPKTKAQIIAEAQVVKNATEVGENTATRVGTVLEDLAEKINEYVSGRFYGYAATSADLPEGDEVGYAYVGSSPFEIWNFDGTTWSDSGATIANAPVPNMEDIDYNTANELQFANRVYNSTTPDGLGYKILRKTSTFAAQVTEANTIYEIRYEFDLNGGSVTMPSGCVLKFEGGSVKNGSLLYDNTLIIGAYTGNIACSCTGAVSNTYASPYMYGYTISGDIYSSLQAAIEYNSIIIIPEGSYYTTKTIRVPSNRKILGKGNVVINSQIAAYNYSSNPYKDGSIVNVAVFAMRGVEDGVDYSDFSGTSGDFLCGNGTALTSGTYSLNYVDIADTSAFDVGDIVLISEGLGYWHYVKQEMAEIASKTGTRLTFKNPLRYSYNATSSGMGDFFKTYASPTQPSGSQPILADFVGCGLRKISPIRNVSIENITINTSTEGASSKLGVFITLAENIQLRNLRLSIGRLWITDSQDIRVSSCHTSLRNSYAGNGSNHIVYDTCSFCDGLQIEEGASDIVMRSCEILSTATPFSIIAHSKNVLILHCNIAGRYTNNVCISSSVVKNVSFVGCSVVGGSTALNFKGSPFSTRYPSATAFASNKDLVEYYDGGETCIASHFEASSTQKSIINEHTAAYMNVLACVSVSGVTGNYNGDVAGEFTIQSIKTGSLSVDSGKGAMSGLIQTSSQLNPSTFVVNARGAWGGESNGSGAEIEGSKSWVAIGCRNGGSNGKLMQNGYDFGIFHINNDTRLLYRQGNDAYYHPILSDISALVCETSTRPGVSHRAEGVCYYDKTLGKPIWWNGSSWVDATGAAV